MPNSIEPNEIRVLNIIWIVFSEMNTNIDQHQTYKDKLH